MPDRRWGIFKDDEHYAIGVFYTWRDAMNYATQCNLDDAPSMYRVRELLDNVRAGPVQDTDPDAPTSP